MWEGRVDDFLKVFSSLKIYEFHGLYKTGVDV